jgi:hypothetical protein
MSLKAFHVVFVIASIILALGFGAWSLRDYFDGGPRSNLWFGIGSLIAGIALICYARSVLKKLKNISYL